MNEYSVLWIRKEFTYHYFYKNHILFRFIRLYQQNQNRHDLSLQFDYITNKFPQKSLVYDLFKQRFSSADIEMNMNAIHLYSGMQFVTLHIYEKQIKFYCKTLHDAEKLLFPTLRSLHPFLFIIGNNVDDYGWISPVRNRKAYKEGQVLYSFL